MQRPDNEADTEVREREVAANAGFAVRKAVEAGIISPDTSWVKELDYDELRELSWEERGAYRD